MTEIKSFADRYLEKFMSRKLLVWLTTTGLLFADKLDGEQFVAISLVYIGLQGMADIAATWKSGRPNSK
jgi:hypothetical protein